MFGIIGNWLARLRRDKRGVSAIEFALVFPVLLLIYFGVVELTQVLSVDRKVTSIASSTGDLVSQETNLDSTMIADIFQASLSIIAPFTTNSVSIVVTSVEADDNNVTTVGWSDAFNGTAKSPGAAISVPQGLTQPNTSVIFTEVAYNYNSILGQLISGTITLTDSFYARPRNSANVTRQ